MLANSRHLLLLLFAALSLSACETAGRLPQAPRAGEPAGLVGLSPQAVRAQFGKAAFERQEGTSRLWRYDGAACKAFFFFYVEGNTLAVRHVETVPRGASIAADITCLDALRGLPPSSQPSS
jgi:hypothetical protein